MKIKEFITNEKQIIEFQNKYGFVIPDQYQDFLKRQDGCIFDSGVRLYGLDDLKEMNEMLQVQMYQPDYMAIGDDSGGLIFMMKQEINAKELFVVDISDYDLETAFCKIASNITYAKAVKLMEKLGQTDIFEYRDI